MTGWRFWPVYLLGWSPLFAVYAFAVSSGGASPRVALVSALYDIAPAVALGVAVIRVAQRWTAETEKVGFRFLLRHLGAAVAFSILCTVGTLAMFLAHRLMAMGSIGIDRSQVVVLAWLLFINGAVYVALAAGASVIGLQARLQEEQARASRAEALRSRAELEALRSRLDPHFLFNTLHSLLILVRHDQAAAEDALERFGDLLRYPLRLHREKLDEVTLDEEWTFCLDYLSLESLRLGERIRIDAELDEEARECRIPAFSLQPLLENAVRHGISPRRDGGGVRLWAKTDDGRLELGVADDGPGTDARSIEESGGQGLRLVRHRLAVLYGPAARLVTRSPSEGGFEALLSLPIRRDTGRS